jgi:hypothetical protein
VVIWLSWQPRFVIDLEDAIGDTARIVAFQPGWQHPTVVAASNAHVPRATMGILAF